MAGPDFLIAPADQSFCEFNTQAFEKIRVFEVRSRGGSGELLLNPGYFQGFNLPQQVLQDFRVWRVKVHVELFLPCWLIDFYVTLLGQKEPPQSKSSISNVLFAAISK
jgi:hypothetical protein